MYLCKQEHGFSVFLRVCNLEAYVPLSLHMYKSMFRPEVIRRVELCFFRPWKTSIPASDVRDPPHGYPYWIEPDCNCCLSNKCTYMQLRSPEVTRVNFQLYVDRKSVV